MEHLTQQILEFDKIQTFLEQFALSALGREAVRKLIPISDLEQIEQALTEVSELKDIRTLHGHLPLGGLHDIRGVLAHAHVHGEIIPPLELRQIYSTLRAGRATQKFIAAIDPPQYPNIREKAENIETTDAVEQAIRHAIDEEGEILDGASQKLKHIRKDLRQTRAKIQTWLQNFLQRQDYQSVIQDTVITSRNDRYVVPIKSASRGKVKGIVHDQSSSGVTVFVEPLETVELNNKIATLEAEEKQEIRRILLEITACVRDHLPTINQTLKILGELDFINAKARLSEQWRGNQPELCRERRLHLLQARHPLLLMQHDHDPEKVVPLTLKLKEDETTLLITGPNTGGKTVSLKTIGLLTLMVQAGLHIPAAPDSEVCVFRHVYADIGDQQSIEQNLSTFSSHISHIVEILAEADEQSLVLLDELGAGTDPAEGASLGIAILEHLDRVRATCIATTHHDALKSYAYTHPRTLNACVEFDVNTLSPTYRLLIGLPGKSNAYIIAERLGLPSAIIQRARSLMGEEIHQVADLIQKLTSETQVMEKQKADVEARLRGVNRLERETDRLLALAEEERQQMLEKAVKEAQEIVDNALQQSQTVLAKLPKTSREAGKELIKTLHHEARSVRQRAKRIRKQPEPVSTVQPHELHEGQRVQVRGMGHTGTLVNLSKDRKQAEVQVGALKLDVAAHQLIPLAASKKHEKPPTVSVSEVSSWQDDAHMVTPELMLVGKRVDEALEAMDKYLDQAFLSGYSSVTIVHGIGTGKLKSAVSQFLRKHAHVTKYALDEQNSGATVAHLQRK